MYPLFAATLFLSAALLFVVQTMFAKMVLPELGGTPSVWNTCMAFFQATLLAGYLWAHLSTRRFAGRRHLLLQLIVVSLPVLMLPLALPSELPIDPVYQPSAWLLAAAVLSVGLPFLALATTNPTLQVWFAASGCSKSRDPYFLYAASNAGSFLGLIGYPLLLEPFLGLSEQWFVWTIGYGLLIGLQATCVFWLWRRQSWGRWAGVESVAGPERHELEASPTWRRRLTWLGLAAIPSSLMMGVTTFLTTDVASFPLLWVLPLGLYLATYILAFSARLKPSTTRVVQWLPWALLPVVATHALSGDLVHHWSTYVVHLLGFFVAALLCHGRLADLRPGARDLTEFYLWTSAGGVVGGVFNTLVAPVLFVTPVEYGLALVAVGFALPMSSIRKGRIAGWLDVMMPLGLGVACLFLAGSPLTAASRWGYLAVILIPVLIGVTFVSRPMRFGLGIAAVFLAGLFSREGTKQVLCRERSFFGTNRVVATESPARHLLVHGTTFHGWQYRDERRSEPPAYYHRQGPLGVAFDRLADRGEVRVGVVGLGCGTIMAYHRPGWHFTFYEIDPAVVRIAENPEYFTYLADHQGEYEVVVGDARLQLERAKPQGFDLLVLDAFSSDTIPIHLMTREALAAYRRHLKPDGLLAFHISNRHLDLRPVLGALAQDAGLRAIAISDAGDLSSITGAVERAPSRYVFLTGDRGVCSQLLEDPRAAEITIDSSRACWTDDRCHVLEALIW